MKLYIALKLKKKLAGEIAKLKSQIQSKNSYVEGSANATKYSVDELENELVAKIDKLVVLKMAINKANANIQELIFRLAEIKGLLLFWQGVSTTEGISRSYGDAVIVYKVQVDEKAVEQRVKELQEKVDAIQEEIDAYNYTADVEF